MDYKDLIEIGLNGEAALKLIMRGSLIENNGDKAGVVSVIFATTDKDTARKKINDLLAVNRCRPI